MKSENNIESLLERTDIPEDVKEILEKFITSSEQVDKEILELKEIINSNQEKYFGDKLKLFEMEEALSEAQEKLELVMDNIPHHVFWKGLNSKYLGCNKNYAQAIGLKDPKMIIGKGENDLHWSEEEVLSFHESDRRVIETGEAEIQTFLHVIRIDGTAGTYEVNKVPLRDGKGNIIGTLGTSQDISHRIKLENELRKVKLEQERFHAMMGHFNRNDLQKIINNLAYLASMYSIDQKLDVALRTIELSYKADSHYLRANPEQKRRLLKSVLSNCYLKDSTLYPVYNKAFDIFAKGIVSNQWRRGRDSNPG